MPMFLSLRYSTMVSCIVSTTFSVIKIPTIATPLFSTFINQNTKITTDPNNYSTLEERRKALLKTFLIDVDRLTLLRRPQDVIFKHIFKNTFLCRCFSILTIGRHRDM